MLFITTFSLVLLWINSDSSPSRELTSPLISGWQYKVVKSFKTKPLARLANSFCMGNKLGLSPTYRKQFKRLGIYHLFTPSGIHLTSLLLFLSPLLFLLRRKGKWWSRLLDLVLIIGSQMLPGLHSLKRIVLLGAMIRHLRYKGEPLPLFTNFLLSFGLSFLMGNYHQSPLSFSYSFLFLGMICALEKEPKYKIPLALFGAQLIVSFFQGEGVFWTNVVISPVLTAIFSLVFPLIFFTYFIPPTWEVLEGMLKLFVNLVELCGDGAQHFGVVVGTPLLVGGFILLMGSKSLKTKGLIVGTVLSLHCGELYNLPPSSFKKIRGAPATSYGKLERIRRTKRGFVVKYANGRTCYPKLYPKGFYERCKS